MAEEMVLRIVLEGIDNASDDIERTSNKTKILGQELDDTTVSAAGLLLAVNGLASGLNQVSGGMRKFADSGERAGYISDQSAERIRGWSDTLEFAAGPLEIIAGLANFVASIAIAGKFGPALLKGTRIARLFGLAVAGVGVFLGSTVIVIGLLVGSVLLLGSVIFEHRQQIKELAMEYEIISDTVKGLTDAYDNAKDAVEGFTDAITHPGRTLTNFSRDAKDSLSGVGMGGLA